MVVLAQAAQNFVESYVGLLDVIDVLAVGGEAGDEDLAVVRGRQWRLFRIQGVEVAVLTRASASARRWSDRGRGLPMMGVPTPPTGKTSTCLTLPSLALT